MNLGVPKNSEAHLVLWQSLPMGQKSSHNPEVPISHLAVILHGLQDPPYLTTYLLTQWKRLGLQQK